LPVAFPFIVLKKYRKIRELFIAPFRVSHFNPMDLWGTSRLAWPI
jgi:hypothetical protein